MIEVFLLVSAIVLLVVLIVISSVILLKKTNPDNSENMLSLVQQIKNDTGKELSDFRQEINRTTSIQLKVWERWYLIIKRI